MQALATTVLIPVKNGGARLDECLEAVLNQKTSFPFEVLCIDSGSTDGSLDTIRKHRCRLHQIPSAEFGHGKTRNLGVRLAQTPFVALITQDAVPADAHWLEELITPFQWDDTLAGVFGRHLPHVGCRDTEAMMLERHFAAFGDINSTVRIGQNPRTWAEYSRSRDFFIFFSDNNAALRKSVWEKIPYPDVEFMEDQLWSAAVLEAGYAKGWAPRAAVRHSHNYDTATTLRRAFDESRFRRAYQAPEQSWTIKRWLEHARLAAKRDLARLRGKQGASWLPRAPGIVARTHADAIGRYLGDKAPLLPKAVVNRLSQHVGLKGTAELADGGLPSEVAAFARETLATKGKIDGVATLTHEALHVLRAPNVPEAVLSWQRSRRRGGRGGHWWESTLYQSMMKPAGPLLSSRAAIQQPELVLNWVIPPFGRGGGGHNTIFRTIHLLEKRGVINRVFVQDGDLAMPYPSAQLRALAQEWFSPIEASVQPLRDHLPPADFNLATHWTTAWATRALGGSVAQAYFVQDHEPQFYASGAEASFAEQTYDFGFYGITAGRWLATLMREKYGMQAEPFELAVDHHLYWPEAPTRQGRSVFGYVRPQTQRRGFELMCLALAQVKRQRPDVEIHLAGAELHQSMIPFAYHGHGVLDSARLRHEYANATVGVCLSFTNYSLLPQEMAATGCPIIDIDGEHTRGAYPPGAVALAPPTVDGLATKIIELLDNETLRQRYVQHGLAYARELTWERSADAVLKALQTWSGRPEAEKPPRLSSQVTP